MKINAAGQYHHRQLGLGYLVPELSIPALLVVLEIFNHKIAGRNISTRSKPVCLPRASGPAGRSTTLPNHVPVPNTRKSKRQTLEAHVGMRLGWTRVGISFKTHPAIGAVWDGEGESVALLPPPVAETALLPDFAMLRQKWLGAVIVKSRREIALAEMNTVWPRARTAGPPRKKCCGSTQLPAKLLSIAHL